jgi:hypothetical protein
MSCGRHGFPLVAVPEIDHDLCRQAEMVADQGNGILLAASHHRIDEVLVFVLSRNDHGMARQMSRIGVKAPGMIAVMAPVGSGVKRGFERPQECGFLLDFAMAVSPFSGIGLGLRKLSPSMTMR